MKQVIVRGKRLKIGALVKCQLYDVQKGQGREDELGVDPASNKKLL